MEKILDFSQPLDVNLLDQITHAMHVGNPEEMMLAQKVLTQFQEHPDSWLRVDRILEYSQVPASKIFALSILENVIKFKWKILPKEQREGIKNYIVNLIIKTSSNPQTLRSEASFLSKLNLILVQIIKQEWPRNWENFIPEIVGASKTNESLCENNMQILKLMSEEVFDFSSGQMTQAKARELKNSFNKEFSLIYQLCEQVLDQSQNPYLLSATLQTLLRFLNWIPLGFIFETKMIDTLVYRFLPVPIFQNNALECLTEIAGLNLGTLQDQHFEKLYHSVMNQLPKILSPEVDIAQVFETGTETQQSFIQFLALFLTTFFKVHLLVVEKPEHHSLLLLGHNYLTKISFVDDLEIFKICLEYWNKLASDLYHEAPPAQSSPLFLTSQTSIPESPRRKLYSQILHRVREALIRRMPRPEEVLIVEDENGEIVKEAMKDSDSIALYKTMKETLVFLTHLDYEDTQSIMLMKLVAQVDGTEWSWNNLNTLCWAIGAISGAQNEEYEKRFLVTVLKDLLGLTEMKRGKDNKAVIASNIMYIVGQYPRFLRAHWKFLKTVVNKLFEFMHESHPGVQDMAVDTFLKIADKCRRKFVVVQIGETQPFVSEILTKLSSIISDLEPQQIHVFYEAVGFMIGSHTDQQSRDSLLAQLMEHPNESWSNIISQAAKNHHSLENLETIKTISNILKTNVRTCSSLGQSFFSQLARIYLDMLNVYKTYSGMISSAVANGGPHITKSTQIKAMRSVKKETLKLIETFIEKCEDVVSVTQNLIPPLLEAVLGDYKTNVPDTRDPEVLSLMAMIINKLKGNMTKEVPRILDHVFECTLQMITKNFQDYPEHRLHFFTLLKAIQTYCFTAFFAISSTHFKLVIDSIVWAFKHTERQISETGLSILYDIFKDIPHTTPEIAASFYRSYFLSLLQDVFYVLTDTFHKSGFKLQASILMHMFTSVQNGTVNTPLWDSSVSDPTMNNERFLREYVTSLLSSAFTNLHLKQIQTFVNGLFEIKDLSLFKNHLRDFLVQLKEFAGDNEELYLEEREAALAEQQQLALKKAMAIPGMIAPSQLPNDPAEMND